MLVCGVCGGTGFSEHAVLWPDLVSEWQLSPAEVAYVDKQQGTVCTGCGANLRSIALANALRAFYGTNDVLRRIPTAGPRRSILEINEAGTLSPVLRRFGGYVFGAWPEVDMHRLPYPDGSFDAVVHSDTLEHIENPVHALGECRRVLRPGGALCFTVPIVVGRMSRDRSGLPKSHHGGPATASDDFVVRTEFGADAWTYPIQAGFTRISVFTVDYPAATAFLAYKT